MAEKRWLFIVVFDLPVTETSHSVVAHRPEYIIFYSFWCPCVSLVTERSAHLGGDVSLHLLAEIYLASVLLPFLQCLQGSGIWQKLNTNPPTQLENNTEKKNTSLVFFFLRSTVPILTPLQDIMTAEVFENSKYKPTVPDLPPSHRKSLTPLSSSTAMW